jgi:hypothetical protein
MGCRRLAVWRSLVETYSSALDQRSRHDYAATGQRRTRARCRPAGCWRGLPGALGDASGGGLRLRDGKIAAMPCGNRWLRRPSRLPTTRASRADRTLEGRTQVLERGLRSNRLSSFGGDRPPDAVQDLVDRGGGQLLDRAEQLLHLVVLPAVLLLHKVEVLLNHRAIDRSGVDGLRATPPA